MSVDGESISIDVIRAEHSQSQNGFSSKGQDDNAPPNPVVTTEWTKHLNNQLTALNSEFISMGFQAFLVQKGLGERNIEIQMNMFSNACYNLFQRYLVCLDARESMDDNLRRLTGDLEQSRKLHQRCQDDLESARMSIAHAREKERKLEAEKSLISRHLKASKEAMRRLQNDSQQRISQFQHETKKREHESFNLRKRLNALMRGPVTPGNHNTSVAVAGNSTADVSRPPSRAGTASSLSGRRCQSSNRSIYGSNLSLNSCAGGDGLGGDLVLRSQLDLAKNQISHLETRENDLFYENRELRDLVSVLATRMFRFARYCRRPDARRPDGSDEEEEETSLDGSESERVGQWFGSDDEPSSDETDDEENLRKLNLTSTTRRQSANVHGLLLQMPFAMVRERLTTRVHRLSRRLWHRLKSISATANQMSRCQHSHSDKEETTPTKQLLEVKETDILEKLKLCEQKLKEKDEILAQALFSNVRRRESLFRLVDQHSSISHFFSDLTLERPTTSSNGHADSVSSPISQEASLLSNESTPASAASNAITSAKSNNLPIKALKLETRHLHFTPSPRRTCPKTQKKSGCRDFSD